MYKGEQQRIIFCNCIFEALTTYMGWPQVPTGRAHYGKAQYQTHCTASLEKWAYCSDSVLCYMSDNASFPRCSTCPQTLVCGK